MTRTDTPENKGVLTPDENAYASDRTQDEFNKTEIERLGRQRPEILSSAIVEFGFVTSIIMSMMMGEFFVSGFNIVLPTVGDSLNIPEPSRTWPAEVPSLTTAALLLPCARLSDRYGGRIVFLAGVFWLVAWSLVCGFSQNTNMLIVCRAMQGLSTAAFLPAGISLLGQTYRPGPRKNFIFALYGAFAVLGFYIGIAIGALTAQLADWRWYFWVGAILAFANAVIGYLTIPKDLGQDGDAALAMDWWGLCTIVPGLVLVIFAFTDGGSAPEGWRTPYVYITLIIGVLFLAAAVYVEGWVAAQPLFPAEVFRPKGMKRLVVSLFCCYGVFGLYLFYVSYYLSTVLHTTPLQTAAWFTPMALGGIFLALMGGLVLHLIPGRILMIISGLGFLLSVLLFALIPDRVDGTPSTSFLYWAYVFPAMLCGTIGVDITYNVTNVFITTSMPSRLQATAGALINSLLYLGIAFWLGVAELAVSQTKEARSDLTPREQYKIAFWLAVGLAALSLILFSTLKIGQASADMTADEKAQLAEELAERERARVRALAEEERVEK
ncbi:MFS general substrate transporter [Apiospora rasikravindrae]|uniref:MFS general substrate transporter n=1 Tax=Apiospora rasikravindrae TaxID=990691 RepID=A0ABR1S2C8_9PEZI